MAMSQRSGGILSSRSRQSNRPVYEDFQPHFELKEENDANVIHVHLPGFLQEQVRITLVSPGVIRVHGQRLLGNNKWSRFNQTFPVQENSDTSKIHGKIKKGIVTITIPKQVIKQIGGPTEAATPMQQRPPTPSKASSTTTGPQESTFSDQKAQNGQESISQTATAAALDEKQRHTRSAPASAEGPPEAAAEPKSQKSGEGIPLAATFTAAEDQKERDAKNAYPLGPPKGIVETKAEKEKDEALAKVISASRHERQDEKRVVPLTSPERGTNEAKSQKSQDDIPPNRMNEKEAESAVKGVNRKGKSEVHGKPAEAKNVGKVVETMLHKETDTGDISNETRVVPKIVKQAKRKSKSLKTAVNQKSKEDPIATNVITAAKQRMENLGKRMNNEDKQMLINMGAAVLVLLALGVSVSYSFWSPGKAKN